MIDWVLLTAAMVVTAILTGIVLRFYRSRQWLDQPVARSAHKLPMPSSGGVAMVVPFLCAIAFYFHGGLLSARETLLFFGCLPLVITGLIDDFRRVDFRWRLLVQFGSGIGAVMLVGQLPGVQFGPWNLGISALVHSLAVLAFVWLINLFNFMDGIDGLAGSETVFVTCLSSLLVINIANQTVFSASMLLGVITLGFLVWNWAPAKLFMGDVGSNFLAYCLAALALLSIADGSLNPWVWLLLLGVFVIDASYTLGRRLLSGQRWYEAHNSHGYQIAARMLGSHAKVASLVLVINLLWLAPLAWLAAENPGLGLYLTVVGYLPLLVLAGKLQAGVPVSGSVESQ